jgi:hypothetical protein
MDAGGEDGGAEGVGQGVAGGEGVGCGHAHISCQDHGFVFNRSWKTMRMFKDCISHF